MKATRLAILILAIALALYMFIPSLSWAADGAAMYKTKMLRLRRPGCSGQARGQDSKLLSNDARKYIAWI
jgi:hypothetical protein